MRRHKKLWIVLGIVVAASAAGALLLRAALPPERLRRLVAAQLQTALGHPVEIAAVRVGFAPLVVRAEGIRIAAPAGSVSPDLLRVRSLEMRPRLLPLLRRQVAVQRIRIAGLELWVEQRDSRTWNWTRPVAAAATAGVDRAASPLAFQIDRLDLEAGRLHFQSAVTAIAATSPLGASITLAADRAWRDVHVEGWLVADSVVATGKLGTARVGRIRLEPDLHVDVADSSATLTRLRLWLNDAPVDFQGTARQTGGKPEFHLTTQSDGLDLAQLLAALPAGAPQTQGLRAAGRVRFDIRADADPGALPVLHGFAELRDGMVQAAGLPEKVSELTARLEMAGDSLRLTQAAARFGRAPVHASGLVLDPALPQRTRYDVRIGAELDLGEVARVVPLAPGTTLAGSATIDLRARGRTARPDSVYLEGPVVLRDLVVTTPLLRVPVRGEARLQGTGAQLRIDSAALHAGTSHLTLRGAITPALPPRLPRLELIGQSGQVDLAALLPVPPGAPGAAGGAAPTAVPPLLPVLPQAGYRMSLTAREVKLETATFRDVQLDVEGGPVAADVVMHAAELRADQVILRGTTGKLRVEKQEGHGTLRAERALLRKIETTGLEGDLEIRGTQVRLPALRGAAYGGTLQGSATVDFAQPAQPKYDLQAKATRIDANTFLGSITPLRNVIAGVIDLESGWVFTGPEPEAVRRTLSGKGQAVSLNGRLQELPVLTELAALLQLPSLGTLPYRDLGLQFAVESGRMTVRDCVLHAPDADIGIGGSIGLDGGLDLGLEVRLSAELSKRVMSARRTGALTSLFADPQGRLVFDVKAGGTGRAPKVHLDFDKTKTRAGLAALTDAAVRRFLGGALGRGTAGAPPDSGSPATPPPGAADAGRKALEEARKKLGGTLGGLLGRPTPADSTPKH